MNSSWYRVKTDGPGDALYDGPDKDDALKALKLARIPGGEVSLVQMPIKDVSWYKVQGNFEVTAVTFYEGSDEEEANRRLEFAQAAVGDNGTVALTSEPFVESLKYRIAQEAKVQAHEVARDREVFDRMMCPSSLEAKAAKAAQDVQASEPDGSNVLGRICQAAREFHDAVRKEAQDEEAKVQEIAQEAKVQETYVVSLMFPSGSRKSILHRGKDPEEAFKVFLERNQLYGSALVKFEVEREDVSDPGWRVLGDGVVVWEGDEEGARTVYRESGPFWTGSPLVLCHGEEVIATRTKDDTMWVVYRLGKVMYEGLDDIAAKKAYDEASDLNPGEKPGKVSLDKDSREVACRQLGETGAESWRIVNGGERVWEGDVERDAREAYREMSSPKSGELLELWCGARMVKTRRSVEVVWSVFRDAEFLYEGYEKDVAWDVYAAAEEPVDGTIVVSLYESGELIATRTLWGLHTKPEETWRVIRGDRVLYDGISECSARSKFGRADMTEDGPESMVILEKCGFQVAQRHGWPGPAWKVFMDGQVIYYGQDENEGSMVFLDNYYPPGAKMQFYQDDDLLESRTIVKVQEAHQVMYLVVDQEIGSWYYGSDADKAKDWWAYVEVGVWFENGRLKMFREWDSNELVVGESELHQVLAIDPTDGEIESARFQVVREDDGLVYHGRSRVKAVGSHGDMYQDGILVSMEAE